MKVCVVGAGAIGGFIGTRLALAGACQLSALARGATLAALQSHGWRLREAGQLRSAPAKVSGEAAALGRQDLLIVAVKGPSLEALAPQLAPLLGADTVVLPAMNGVPWWFSAATPALGGQPLHSVDPGGRILSALPLAQVLGCVVHASSATEAPGLVVHAKGQRLIVGEPLGGASSRGQAVAALLRHAGFEVDLSDELRRELWYKLWGNMTMNPVSALTGATVDHILRDPELRGFCSAVMREAAAVGERIGCRIDQSPEARHGVTSQLGAFKTSMLQDVEAGRPIELDPLVTAVQEMAQRLGIQTPFMDALLGLARLFGRTRGLYLPAVAQ